MRGQKPTLPASVYFFYSDPVWEDLLQQKRGEQIMLSTSPTLAPESRTEGPLGQSISRSVMPASPVPLLCQSRCQERTGTQGQTC